MVTSVNASALSLGARQPKVVHASATVTTVTEARMFVPCKVFIPGCGFGI